MMRFSTKAVGDVMYKHRVCEYIATNPTHVYIDASSMDKYGLDDIALTASRNGTPISIEIPQTCADPEIRRIALGRHNIDQVNTYHVYNFSDSNYKELCFRLSDDIRKSKEHMGIHLKVDVDAVLPQTIEKFKAACSIALTNCYDEKKNIIQPPSADVLQQMSTYMSYYGEDVYFKIKVVETDSNIADSIGFDKLTLLTVDESEVVM